jgi:predicted O-methyltransferase YrrM
MSFSPTTTMSDAGQIMATFDAWVARQGNGQYLDSTTAVPRETDVFPDFGVQQARSEVAAFVDVILKRGQRRAALEIGLGYYGSTHFLWRLLFDHVVTIEKTAERCRAFCRAYAEFADGHWPGWDGRSGFIFGGSAEVRSAAATYKALPEAVDLLFIDGDHTYAGVMCDWLLYHPIVAPGGIVAFHDVSSTVASMTDVPRFLAEIETGRFRRLAGKVERIVHHPHIGIGYYVVG